MASAVGGSEKIKAEALAGEKLQIHAAKINQFRITESCFCDKKWVIIVKSS